jgi:hypothetical protein
MWYMLILFLILNKLNLVWFKINLDSLYFSQPGHSVLTEGSVRFFGFSVFKVTPTDQFSSKLETDNFGVGFLLQFFGLNRKTKSVVCPTRWHLRSEPAVACPCPARARGCRCALLALAPAVDAAAPCSTLERAAVLFSALAPSPAAVACCRVEMAD